MENTERQCLRSLLHLSPPSYYSKKQRVLRLSPSWRGRARGQGRPVRSQPGLNYFCQAARISGLSSSELARSLHRLSRAGVSPAGRGGAWGGPTGGGTLLVHTQSLPYPHLWIMRTRTQHCALLFLLLGACPRCAQPLFSDTHPDWADSTRMQEAEPNPGLRSPSSQALPAQSPQDPAQPEAALPRCETACGVGWAGENRGRAGGAGAGHRWGVTGGQEGQAKRGSRTEMQT
jgi:hypothetical protein